MGKSYTLVLNFGYVESARLGYMPWTSSNTYKDAKEALADLSEFLKEQYLAHNGEPPKKCCVTTKTKDAEADFCAKCGLFLDVRRFDGEDFSDWLRQLDTDTNDFHGFIEWNPNDRWQAGSLEDAPNQRFVYQAEWVMSAAVGHPIREERTFEAICKERTANKKQSFSYY